MGRCRVWIAGIAFLLVFEPGCRRAPQSPPAPPPAVTVARPVQRQVMEWDEYTGRLEAVETVEVRARVSGFIEEAPFQEGSIIQKGDLLFVIDPRPFDVALARAQAELSRAKAQVGYTAFRFKEVEDARAREAASENDLEDARRQMLTAQAEVAAADAAVRDAELDLEWSRVTAPIAGRISKKFVTPGNLINGGAGEATLLTTITSIDPIYCYIDADEQSVLKYQRLAREGRRISARDARIPCFLQLSDETGFPQEGIVDFVDNRLDPATGTIRGRGVYANPRGSMLPGLFARVRIPGSGVYEALLVPDAAVSADQNQKRLLIVKDDDTVEARIVKTGALFGRFRAIESGLEPGERVVINGVMHARPGAKVSPQEAPISTEALDAEIMIAPAGSTLPSSGAPGQTRPAGAVSP